jgi:hypothetical protein
MASICKTNLHQKTHGCIIALTLINIHNSKNMPAKSAECVWVDVAMTVMGMGGWECVLFTLNRTLY